MRVGRLQYRSGRQDRQSDGGNDKGSSEIRISDYSAPERGVVFEPFQGPQKYIARSTHWLCPAQLTERFHETLGRP